LSAAERATIAWPAIAQIIPPEMYDSIGDKITTRSWTYRVRIAAGEIPLDQPDALMTNRVVIEAVIDLSAPRPRIAYLRDISQLQTTARIAASSSEQNEFAPIEPLQDSQQQPTTAPESAQGDSENGSDEPAASQPEQPATQPQEPTTRPSGAQGKTRSKVGRWKAGE
jgi:hypothetical protein